MFSLRIQESSGAAIACYTPISKYSFVLRADRPALTAHICNFSSKGPSRANSAVLRLDKEAHTINATDISFLVSPLVVRSC